MDKSNWRLEKCVIHVLSLLVDTCIWALLEITHWATRLLGLKCCIPSNVVDTLDAFLLRNSRACRGTRCHFLITGFIPLFHMLTYQARQCFYCLANNTGTWRGGLFSSGSTCAQCVIEVTGSASVGAEISAAWKGFSFVAGQIPWQILASRMKESVKVDTTLLFTSVLITSA